MARPYDVVVWGSTGFMGKLVCEQLTRNYQGKVRWAMAGRNKAKLESVREDMAKLDPSASDVPILLGDTTDQGSVNRVAAQTKVLISTSGPYAKLGTPIVRACVQESTHYADITGETPWVLRMIKEFDEEARRKGVKIVTFAGFDSIPSDLGTQFVVKYMQDKLGRKCAKVHNVFSEMQGGAPSGTIASLFGLIAEPTKEQRQVRDPYCLDPADSRRGPDKPEGFGISFCKELRQWTFPFIMAPVNTRCVRRSNALLAHSYGSNFSYEEHFGTKRLMMAVLATAVMGFGYALLTFKPLQPLWSRLMTKVPAGPSRKVMEGGSWRVQTIGVTEAQAGEQPETVIADLQGPHDPGCLDTSRMVTEAGVCMATQDKALQQADMLPGGVLTPASAMGMVLVHRLQAIGMTFKIRDDPSWGQQ